MDGAPEGLWLGGRRAKADSSAALRNDKQKAGVHLGDGGVDWAGLPDGGFGDEAVEDGSGGGAGVVAALGVPLEAEDEVGVGVVGALSAFDGLDDGVLRAAGGDVQAVAGDGEGLVVAGVDGQAEKAVLFGGFVLGDEAAEQGIRRDRRGVGDCDGAAGGVVHGHGSEVLDEGSAAPDVERLHAEADGEQGFMQVVGVLEEQFVDGLAAGSAGADSGSGSWPYFWGLTSAPLPGSRMPWQLLMRSATAAWGEVERDLHRFSAGALDRIGVLRPGALAVGEVSAVGDGDGDAGLHDLYL